MNHATQHSVRFPRLNPFVFPSDTDFRFVLLIFAVLSSTLFIYNTLSADFLSKQIATALQCTYFPSMLSPGNAVDLIASYQRDVQCQSLYLRPLLLWLIGGIMLVMFIALIIYWFFPLWKIRREKFAAISREDAPEVIVALNELCAEAKVTSPHFLWNPLNHAHNAEVFGYLGQYYVALSGGFVTLFYTDEAAFRATILHELAHVRNADINKTYFTIALWRAFVIGALLPFGIYLLVKLPFSLLLTVNLLWRVAVMVALVYLTRNAVLRSREFYADLRASSWGATAALSRILDNSNSIAGCWQQLMSVHPTPDERKQTLNDPRRLFRAGLWEAFGVGIATGVALPHVQTLLGWIFYLQLVDYRVIVMPNLLGTIMVFAPLIMGTVGLRTWRTVFAASVEGRVPRNIGQIGLCLGLGIVLGIFSSFAAFLETSSLSLLFKLFIYNLPWILLLLGGFYYFFKWIAATGTVWLNAATTPHSLRAIYSLGLLIGGIVLLGWSAQLFQFSYITTQILQIDSSMIGKVLQMLFIDMLHQPMTFLMILGVWLFPLASYGWQKHMLALAGQSWVFMEKPFWQAPLSPPSISKQWLSRTWKVSLFGGFIFCALLFLIRFFVHFTELGAAINQNDDWINLFYSSQIVVAIIFQIGEAVIIVAMNKTGNSLHALMSAWISGCIMVLGILALNLLFGGTIDAEITWLTVGFVLNGGAFLVLLVTIGMSTVTHMIRP